MGLAQSKTEEKPSTATEGGYQLLEDAQSSDGNNMEANNEKSTATNNEPPLYSEGSVIKIDDAIEAIGMGK